MKYSKTLFLLAFLLISLLAVVPLPQVPALTNNGITLGTWYDVGYGGYKCYVASPNHYNFTQQFGYGYYLEGIKGWNLTRLGITPAEQIFTNNDWLVYLNASAKSSAYYTDNPVIRTNTTFSDSLGSGIKLNVTYVAHSSSRITVYQIFKFYPTFLTMQLTLKNTYDATGRRIGEVRLLSQGTYGVYLDTPSNVRWTGMGSEDANPCDRAASSIATLRTPTFWYSTTKDRGFIIDEIEHKWDWGILNNAYHNANPSNQIYIRTVISDAEDWNKMYKDLSQNESLDVGTLFVQLTGRQIDDAYETLGSIYTSLYAGRGSLSGFTPFYNTWSPYSETMTWAQVKADVDYLAAHPELGIKTIQLDEGWDLDAGKWTTIHPDFSATETLQTVINYIKGKGFHVGLWVAPWEVGTWALANATIKSWFLNDSVTTNYMYRDANARYTMRYYMNPTTTVVRNFITAQLNTLVSMGVDFFKLDFMETASCTQRFYSEITWAEWNEYAFNITKVLPASVFCYSAVPIWHNGMKQPYYSQFWNLVRISWDTTNLIWASQTLPSYLDYHVCAPLFNHLRTPAHTDQLGDDALYGNARSDAEWRFNLVYHGLDKAFYWSNNFATANAIRLEWAKRLIALHSTSWTWNWTQRDYWDNSGVNRVWMANVSNTLYVAVFNPTSSAATVSLNFTKYLDVTGNLKVWEKVWYQDQVNLVYANVSATSVFSVYLSAKDARFFIINPLGTTPTGVYTVEVAMGGIIAVATGSYLFWWWRRKTKTRTVSIPT